MFQTDFLIGIVLKNKLVERRLFLKVKRIIVIIGVAANVINNTLKYNKY